jgi:hypothetical protein
MTKSFMTIARKVAVPYGGGGGVMDDPLENFAIPRPDPKPASDQIRAQIRDVAKLLHRLKTILTVSPARKGGGRSISPVYMARIERVFKDIGSRLDTIDQLLT